MIRIRRFEGSREVEKEIPEYTPRPDEPFSFTMIAVGTFGLCEWSDEKLHADFLYSVFAASMERTIVAGFVRNGRRRSEDHPVSRSTRVRRASFSDRLPRKERDGGKQDLSDQRASQSRHSELAHDALHGDRFRCLAGLYSLYWPILTLQTICTPNSRKCLPPFCNATTWRSFSRSPSSISANSSRSASNSAAVFACTPLFDLSLTHRGMEYIPQDKAQLQACIKTRVCTYEKLWQMTHVSVF